PALNSSFCFHCSRLVSIMALRLRSAAATGIDVPRGACGLHPSRCARRLPSRRRRPQFVLARDLFVKWMPSPLDTAFMKACDSSALMLPVRRPIAKHSSLIPKLYSVTCDPLATVVGNCFHWQLFALPAIRTGANLKRTFDTLPFQCGS